MIRIHRKFHIGNGYAELSFSNPAKWATLTTPPIKVN